MEDAGWRVSALAMLHEQADGDTLLDVEDVFVFAAVGRALPLLGVAMQVEDVYFVEVVHEASPHPAEGWGVQIAMVGNEAEDTFAGAFDAPLREADEFDVIVVQPLWVALSEWFAVDVEVATGSCFTVVAAEEACDPLSFVGRVSGVRGISQDDHDGLVTLDCVGLGSFVGDFSREPHHRNAPIAVHIARPIEAIGEEDVEPPLL